MAHLVIIYKLLSLPFFQPDPMFRSNCNVNLTATCKDMILMLMVVFKQRKLYLYLSGVCADHFLLQQVKSYISFTYQMARRVSLDTIGYNRGVEVQSQSHLTVWLEMVYTCQLPVGHPHRMCCNFLVALYQT